MSDTRKRGMLLARSLCPKFGTEVLAYLDVIADEVRSGARHSSALCEARAETASLRAEIAKMQSFARDWRDATISEIADLTERVEKAELARDQALLDLDDEKAGHRFALEYGHAVERARTDGMSSALKDAHIIGRISDPVAKTGQSYDVRYYLAYVVMLPTNKRSCSPEVYIFDDLKHVAPCWWRDAILALIENERHGIQ